MIKIHDYDSDQLVFPGEVNLTRWTLRHNDGYDMAGLILWFATSIECHSTQAGWAADQVPYVWDSTGVGSIDIASHVQCGGCGTLIYPYATVIEGDDVSGEQIQKAAEALLAQVASSRESGAQAVRRRLTDRLRAVLDDGAVAAELGEQDWRREYPALDGMPEPGIGLDNGELVAWDYDPRSDSADDFIQVGESDLT